MEHRAFPSVLILGGRRSPNAGTDFRRLKSMVELTGGGALISIAENCSHAAASNSPGLPEQNAVDLDQTAPARSSVTHVKDSMRETLGSIMRSGAADQMRGYANRAMGKTKLTLGMAAQSPNLTLSGLAQIVVGEFQKSIGEAKLAEDEEDILPGL
jgi:uncharacterized protein YjbJ (UPF0337 family)